MLAADRTQTTTDLNSGLTIQPHPLLPSRPTVPTTTCPSGNPSGTRAERTKLGPSRHAGWSEVGGGLPEAGEGGGDREGGGLGPQDVGTDGQAGRIAQEGVLLGGEAAFGAHHDEPAPPRPGGPPGGGPAQAGRRR